MLLAVAATSGDGTVGWFAYVVHNVCGCQCMPVYSNARCCRVCAAQAGQLEQVLRYSFWGTGVIRFWCAGMHVQGCC
jgi:hypothetical protein